MSVILEVNCARSLNTISASDGALCTYGVHCSCTYRWTVHVQHTLFFIISVVCFAYNVACKWTTRCAVPLECTPQVHILMDVLVHIIIAYCNYSWPIVSEHSVKNGHSCWEALYIYSNCFYYGLSCAKATVERWNRLRRNNRLQAPMQSISLAASQEMILEVLLAPCASQKRWHQLRSCH